MLVALFIVPGVAARVTGGDGEPGRDPQRRGRVIAGPAVLILIGANLDRWRIGAASDEAGRSRPHEPGSARRCAGRRRWASLIGAVVLVLAAPAIGLKTGPPSARQLATGRAGPRGRRTDQRRSGPASTRRSSSRRIGTGRSPTREARRPAPLAEPVAALPGVQVGGRAGQVTKAVETAARSRQCLLVQKGGPVATRPPRPQPNHAGGVGQTARRGLRSERRRRKKKRGPRSKKKTAPGGSPAGSRPRRKEAKKRSGGARPSSRRVPRSWKEGANKVTKGQEGAQEGAEIVHTNYSFFQLQHLLGPRIVWGARKHPEKPDRYGALQDVDARKTHGHGRLILKPKTALQLPRRDDRREVGPELQRNPERARRQANRLATFAGLVKLQADLIKEAGQAREISFWTKTGIQEVERQGRVVEELVEGEKELVGRERGTREKTRRSREKKKNARHGNAQARKTGSNA